MEKLTAERFCEILKYIEQKRKTFYSNVYPYNCGYIYANKMISFDCWNLIKTIINYPAIYKKMSPAGFYVKPGRVIPDWDGCNIMKHCKDVSTDFKKLQPGEMLYMDQHMGAYVGDYTDPSGVVNVIECTSDMGGGVLSSYVDSNGRRFNHKGGYELRSWEEHGKLTAYISYKEEAAKRKTITQIAKEVIAGKWGVYPERKKKLEKAGYDYEKVQAKVNELLKK